MEYTIYGESIVYYALKNEKGEYLLSENGAFKTGYSMDKLVLFTSIDDATNVVTNEDVKDIFGTLTIHKIKIIDIGGLEQWWTLIK